MNEQRADELHRYRVKGRCGAIVRTGVELSSEQVAVLDQGEIVVGREAQNTTNIGGQTVPRIQISSPVFGFVSMRVVERMPEKMIADDDEEDGWELIQHP